MNSRKLAFGAIGFGLVFWIVIAIAVHARHAQQARFRPAVRAVIDRCKEAQTNLPYPNPSVEFMRVSNGEALLARVRRIDVTACPDDFRTAWRDYIEVSGRLLILQRTGNGKGFDNLRILAEAYWEFKHEPVAAILSLSKIDTSDSPELIQAKRDLAQRMKVLIEVTGRYLPKKK